MLENQAVFCTFRVHRPCKSQILLQHLVYALEHPLEGCVERNYTRSNYLNVCIYKIY